MMESSVYAVSKDVKSFGRLQKWLNVRFIDPRDKSRIEITLCFYSTKDDVLVSEYAGMLLKLSANSVEEPKCVEPLYLCVLWNGAYHDITKTARNAPSFRTGRMSMG